MLVAIPWIISSFAVTEWASIAVSSLFLKSRIPSISILPPIYSKRIRAIYGINFWNSVNAFAALDTQTQPIIGIANWKAANVPAIRFLRPCFISGSARPFTIETEKASMASPTPRSILFMKNAKFRAPPKGISVYCLLILSLLRK